MSLNLVKQNEAVPIWKTLLRKNFRRLDQLTSFLELSEEQCALLVKSPTFSLNVPLRLAQKMQKGTIHDPLFKQFVPTLEELVSHPEFTKNPVGDVAAQKESKLLHKYMGRALILVSSACVMNCRYCFRQHFPYENERKGFEKEIEKIRQDPTIHEVLLSGGDPLSLSNDLIEELLKTLVSIPHIKRIRFHTRFPIGIPERIDENFLKIIKECPLQIYFVLHINHPNELDAHLFAHLKELQLLGVILLNQAVLLRGINDNVTTLVELCEQLANQGILPYYLNQLDRVEGGMHFEVEEEKGVKLIKEIAKHLPGYAVPKYIREIAGEPFKTPL